MQGAAVPDLLATVSGQAEQGISCCQGSDIALLQLGSQGQVFGVGEGGHCWRACTNR